MSTILPAEYITPIFRPMQAINTPASPMAEPIIELLNYIQSNWIDSIVCPPAAWTVFNRSVCTNSDTGGWHRRLNSTLSRHNRSFYQLVQLLHNEACFISVQIQFVTDDKLNRDQRTRYKRQQTKYLIPVIASC